jgi:hypothetical protein
VREFVDAETAKRPGRAGFEEMIKFLKRSSVRVLLVKKNISRQSRAAISTALFKRVQEILEGRYSTKEKVTKHEFTFSGLVHCGHCGCALVGEKKKRQIRLLLLYRQQRKMPRTLRTRRSA